MDIGSFGGILYLYNGGSQPEIRSVSSEEETLRFAADFLSARLEQPGKPAVWIKPKNKKATNSLNSEEDVVPLVVDYPPIQGVYDGWSRKGGRYK